VDCPITGEEKPFVSAKDRQHKFLVSQSTIGVMILLVIGSVGAVFFLRILFQQIGNLEVNGVAFGPIICSVLNGVQVHCFGLCRALVRVADILLNKIAVWNNIYQGIAAKLNDWELHETDTDYEDNLIAKTFCFQFVNTVHRPCLEWCARNNPSHSVSSAVL
jgi:hypothetical protein